jgi:hypothetical protein
MDAPRTAGRRRIAWVLWFWLDWGLSSANADSCDSSGVADMVGKKLTPELMRHILRITNVTDIRILSPQEPATGDWRSNRINVQVDPAGVILQIRCG